MAPAARGRGLTTLAVPYDKGVFDIEFDFVDERLRVRTSEGGSREVVLEPKPVATFYGETFAALAALGLEPSIHAVPNEVEPAIPLAEDNRNCSYDGEAARLFWRQLLQGERVLSRFRSEFVGKASPVLPDKTLLEFLRATYAAAADLADWDRSAVEA